MGAGTVGGWRRAHQLAHQEVPAALADVGQVVDEHVLGPGDDQQLEVLVGGDEPVGQPHRVVRVDLVVHLAVDEQQLARQPVREVHVGGTGPGLGIVRAVVGLHEAQVEVAGVVRAGKGDADLVQLGEVQHRPRCGEPATGVAEHAHPVQVHPRPGPGQLSQRRDMVGQAARVGQAGRRRRRGRTCSAPGYLAHPPPSPRTPAPRWVRRRGPSRRDRSSGRPG